MTDSLYSRIITALERSSWSRADLQSFMKEHGIEYDLILIDAYCEPQHILLIAGFLEEKVSHLMQVGASAEEYCKALFHESWPNYASRVGCSAEKAWGLVTDTLDFRSENRSNYQRRIEYALNALLPPETISPCYYPDCDDDCITRCKSTGRLIGPEG